ncbi:MAG: cytochrome c biogenesis protein ResB [Geobacter sp.]|nr:MAG: cytochrome c biogenesis protein ResB [Geobacter sp.]
MSNDQRKFLHSLWDMSSSLKLTMFLLIALAVLSIIGTIIPQGPPPQEYIAQISPNKLKLYQLMGFFDMYHSWWFILMLYLLTVNLVACSFKRLPHVWKTITRPEKTLSTGLEQALANHVTIKATGDQELMKTMVAAFLKEEFAEPVVTEINGDWHLFAQKAPWCRLSVYFVHLSIIIIFIGAMIGSLFGFKGFVNIVEGEGVSKVVSNSNKEIDLGFGVFCEQFSVAHYPSGAPKEFKSILTVVENGRPVPGYEHVRVIVNDPLTYKGITFYQSSYGNTGNYFFTISNPDGKNSVPLTVHGQSSVNLPDGSSMHVIEATDDISQYVQGLSGPAAQVEIHPPNGASEQFLVYANHPELNIRHAQQHGKGPVLDYKGAEQRMYTGLQVARDPGVWVVWLGCALMVAGIFAAFFMSHRRIWVRIQNGTVTIGGNASKNQAGFQVFFDQLADRLKTKFSGEVR